MKHITYVYVAGPFTHGDRLANIAAAIDAGDKLIKAGFIPFIPHLTALWEKHTKAIWDYEDWLSFDLKWLSKCDAVFRIPGHSPGADREVAHAEQLAIPVYTSFEQLLIDTDKDIPDELRW